MAQLKRSILSLAFCIVYSLRKSVVQDMQVDVHRGVSFAITMVILLMHSLFIFDSTLKFLTVFKNVNSLTFMSV